MANSNTDWGQVAIAAAIVYGIYKFTNSSLGNTLGFGDSGNISPTGATSGSNPLTTPFYVFNPPSDVTNTFKYFFTNNKTVDSTGNGKITQEQVNARISGDYLKAGIVTNQSEQYAMTKALTGVDMGNWVNQSNSLANAQLNAQAYATFGSSSKPQDIAITHSPNVTNGTTSGTVGVTPPNSVRVIQNPNGTKTQIVTQAGKVTSTKTVKVGGLF
jgi:hypothetical protein